MEMAMSPRISIDRETLAEFCRKHYIKRLAIFGSALRDDFRPDSDVDVLVEFHAGHVPGLDFVAIARIVWPSTRPTRGHGHAEVLESEAPQPDPGKRGTSLCRSVTSFTPGTCSTWLGRPSARRRE